MTATTNGASLEDCLTNIFSLIDLNGIRWKRFKHKENNNYLYTPIDTHPILTTYAKCIEENHIAVWRHEPQKKHSTTGSSGHNAGNLGSAGHSNFPTPNRTSNNNTPTGGGPTNLNNSGNQSSLNNTNANSNTASQNNYELWIFGYANQLKVDDVIGDDLVEIEDDNWESTRGLSYECRTLLFKALHNLVERCLISKGFTRFGRWFVQPLSENLQNNNPPNTSNKPLKYLKLEQSSIIPPDAKANLSSSISSTLNMIIDAKNDELDSRQCLDKSDGLRHTSNRSCSSYFTSSLDGSKLSLSFAFSFFVHGDSTVCATVDVRQHSLVHPLTRNDLNSLQDKGIVRVALAPFGLNGILNGVNHKDSDNGAATTTFIQQWSRFYPLPKTLARLVPAKSQNSAMTNFNPKTPTNSTNQYNQSSDNPGSRSYLSNLTNMLLPPSNKPNLYCNHEPYEVPPIVEVIVAGYRMRYPSECVFTTSRVNDLYKSLDVSSKLNPSTIKKPSKMNTSKPNKLSLLSEKLTEDKLDTRTKFEFDQSKTEQPNFNSPFKLISSTDEIAQSNATITTTGTTSIIKLEGSSNSFTQQTTGAEIIKEDIANGCPETDGNTNSSSLSNQTVMRFNSSRVGFGSYNAPLGLTDHVKLFPTPPSLEQIVLSPATQTEEALSKEQTTSSPANVILNTTDISKNNGIDVYKPVECALMPPPPKWAALTNIVISSTKSLPPQCIYKRSSSNSKVVSSKLSEPMKNAVTKIVVASKQFNSPLSNKNLQSTLSPLTDQTNKNGYNNPSLIAPSPKSISSNNLLSGSNSTNLISSLNSPQPPIAATLAVSSSFTLPHQRLFNNLNEISSIQLNLMLSDTVLGMYQDHNFENCTMCACNMSIKGTQFDSIPQRSEASSSNQWRPSISSDNVINSPAPYGENANECNCGFSAITNRHCSHLSGLFLEDELELTNVLYDPTEMIDQNKLFRKVRLSSYSDSSYSEEQKIMTKLNNESSSKLNRAPEDGFKSNTTNKQEKISREDKSSQSNQSVFEETKIFVIDQLKQQCSTMIHSNSSLSKVLLVETFRNNRHLTSCTNYYAQTSAKASSGGPLHRFLDDSNKYTTVKMMNRNPLSLRFSDFCELTKNVVAKLDNQSSTNSCLSSSLVKPIGAAGATGLSSIFSRMLNPARKSIDMHSNNRNNLFAQGLQALVVPTLSVDPKGALQVLEELVKEDAKEALAILNKAILIFSSPVHDWQFITAPIPENNFDVANLLKIIQPYLDESIGSHNKLYKDFVHQQQQHIFSARDSPTGAPVVPTPPCQGPLTWRQFHQAAGRCEDQCEPQPIPTLLVGHHVEKNHLALSPFALKFWDKISLEPYAPAHNMFYLVIAPESQNILENVNTFFKELSNTYELMKLGKHTPIGEGVVLASGNLENLNIEDTWYSDLGLADNISGNVLTRLKSYATKMGSSLAKSIVDHMDERQPPYDPHADRFDSSPIPSENKPVNPLTNNIVNQHNTSNRTFNHLLGATNNTSGAQENYGLSMENHVQTSELSNQTKSQTLIGTHGIEDNIYQEDEANKQTGIVIYMVDPFSSPSISQNLRTLSTIGLFRCYSQLLNHLPENLKMITQLQLISLDSIVGPSRPIFNVSRMDQLKSLSLNVYSRCRKIMANQITAKSLTGFGPAAALDSFFKTKSNEFSIAKMYTPPFILAPTKDKQTELGEMFGDRREKSSVLFCAYCITEDQRWLLVSVTNEKGEISETTVININITDRLKRPKASVRGVALKKMMDFIVSIMSDWTNPWRLVIGKLGRIGHGELKEWASLLSKRSLISYSRILTERCRQCSILNPMETVSILSACLVSLESDSKLRIMPDQFTFDDRQASFNKCPLSTPEDASATHILVFPTSARIHATQNNSEDPALTSGLDDDLLQTTSLLEDEDLGIDAEIGDLFDVWTDNQANISDNISSHHDNIFPSNIHTGSTVDGTGHQDEQCQVLQQPLALGYYMSTAKIGLMPNWFWSTNPHLRDSCPVFLKSALHFHTAGVHYQDEMIVHSEKRKSHQLDSNTTTDVLRYVLEGYNSLSWLALNPKTYDRQSCLPVHMQNLLQLYHLMESFS